MAKPANHLFSSSMFAVLFALSYGPRLIATLAVSRIIDLYGPWLPLWLSLGFTALSILSALFLVEPSNKPISSMDATAGESGDHSSEEAPTVPLVGQLKTEILGGFRAAKAGVYHLINRCNSYVIRLATCLVVMTLAWQSSGENAQIMRKRFGWTWAKASDDSSPCVHGPYFPLTLKFFFADCIPWRYGNQYCTCVFHGSTTCCVLHYDC